MIKFQDLRIVLLRYFQEEFIQNFLNHSTV